MRLDDIYRNIDSCTRCALHRYRMKSPGGEGDSKSKVMIVAQSPGEKENLTGRLFVGPAGIILDELFEANGIKRGDVYITNLIKCFVPRSRQPGQDHISACSEFLDKEIELVKPSVIATLGYYATKYIYEKYAADMITKPDIYDLVGKVYWMCGMKILALQHPSALLYNESARGDMIREYRKIKVLIESCKYYPSCSIKTFYDKGILSEEWVELYCHGDWESCTQQRMKENGLTPPEWMLPDGKHDQQLKKICE